MQQTSSVIITDQALAQLSGSERAELVRLRDVGQLPDEALREMQRQLDFEEVGLR